MFKTVREGASPPNSRAASPAAEWPPACCQERGTEKKPRGGTKPHTSTPYRPRARARRGSLAEATIDIITPIVASTAEGKQLLGRARRGGQWWAAGRAVPSSGGVRHAHQR
eukprot:5523789-Prymnesium_polylepis.1